MTHHNPITLRRPAHLVAGIILTSPHSGRYYPREFLESSRLNENSIRGSEDAFVDELFSMAPELGLPLLAAEFPRAWCDVNREAWELDPSMFADKLPPYVNSTSPRVTAGLGTLAKVVGAGQPIYSRKLYFHEAEQRITQCWHPFHAALMGLIAECKSQFGYCLVLDCHSMPTPISRPEQQPDIILGDNNGTSCSPLLSNGALNHLSALGFSVGHNKPYAGGFITRHYGKPAQNVQALQIEIARRLYMNEKQLTRTKNFDLLRDNLRQFIQYLILKIKNETINATAYETAAE